jgi:hypothetical protein
MVEYHMLLVDSREGQLGSLKQSYILAPGVESAFYPPRHLVRIPVKSRGSATPRIRKPVFWLDSR